MGSIARGSGLNYSESGQLSLVNLALYHRSVEGKDTLERFFGFYRSVLTAK